MKEPVRVVRRRPLLAALLIAGLAATGCARTINHVLADPSRYRDREIRLSGEVRDSYSIADRGAYRIDDRTGQLWVVSDHGVPRTGARVTVRGTIREGFNLGMLANRLRFPPGIGSGLVLVESSHRAR